MGADGIILCGHGSRDPQAVAEFSAMAAQFAAARRDEHVAWGFLEFARPTITESLETLRRAGCQRILALPIMLFAAGHVKNDIPSVLNAFSARHRITIRSAKALDFDSRLLRAAAMRIEDALRLAGGAATREQTLLLTVGRGASDPDANADVAKVGRMLWESMGFGWGATAYSGVTFPLIGAALEHAARFDYQKIVVFPYFLFTGVLVKRIQRCVDEAARRWPNLQFVKAGWLGAHPLVLETLHDRLHGVDEGDNAMNCQLCKYRERIPGFESEQHRAQRGHHHHVEGIGADGHQHGDHPPYPFADHPLGPRGTAASRDS